MSNSKPRYKTTFSGQVLFTPENESQRQKDVHTLFELKRRLAEHELELQILQRLTDSENQQAQETIKKIKTAEDRAHLEIAKLQNKLELIEHVIGVLNLPKPEYSNTQPTADEILQGVFNGGQEVSKAPWEVYDFEEL